MVSSEQIALTQTVQKGGCAAKISAIELRKILNRLSFPKAHKELLVDGRLFDDAGVYQVTEEIAIVQTLDFFTPILDTPWFFGAVAAANALSDVYAMGGKPKTAMGILAYPIAKMSDSVIVDVMQGACDKVGEAQVNLVGGHSIDDDTLKFGLSVTGFVHPKKMWTNAGAKAGDHLILTKALGTGTMTAALKRREMSEEDIIEAINSMTTINNIIDYLGVEMITAIHSATDITGFGLSGHSMQLAKASQVTLKIKSEMIPKFSKTFLCLEKGCLTKAHMSNAAYTEASIDASRLDTRYRQLIHDPQTSGGLLLAVDPKLSAVILNSIKEKFPSSTIIGHVENFSGRSVVFE